MDIFYKDYLNNTSPSFALAEAVHNCKNGDTLHLGGGIIEVDNEFATPQTYYIPRYSDQKKYYAVYMENKSNITIDGEGAELIFSGDVSPFGFKNCKNITLKNFSIDYKTPFFVQGIITNATDDYFDVLYNSNEYLCKYDEKNKQMFVHFFESDFVWNVSACLTNEMENTPVRPASTTADYFLCVGKEHPVYKNMSVLVDVSQLSENHFRYTFKSRKIRHNVGNFIVQACHERKNTNFHFLRCENVLMENIDMYASASFGIMALLCKNITVHCVNSVIKPNSDRMLAVNADIFHIVNSMGKIEISNCIMENNFDDSLNIHSLFSVVKSAINSKTLLLFFPYLAKKALNLYIPGEKINILQKDTFEIYKTVTVSKSEFLGDFSLRVEFDECIDDICPGDLLESADAKPEVYINNCAAGNNRGRGFLVPAGRKTVIENCRFYNFGSGVAANGASATYLEGSAVNGLVVKNNLFDNCARGEGRYPIAIKPISISEKRKIPYHSNIIISDNTFRHNGKQLICIDNASDIFIENNTYILDENQPWHADCGENGILLTNCTDISVDGSKAEK